MATAASVATPVPAKHGAPGLLGRAGRALGSVATLGLTLIAWYVAGLAVRLAVLTFAMRVLDHTPAIAILVVPLAGLARLISYVGMFLAVHRTLRRSRPAVNLTSLSAALIPALVPFMLLYGFWQYAREDWLTYLLAADPTEMGRAAAGGASAADAVGLPVAVLWIVLAVAGAFVGYVRLFTTIRSRALNFATGYLAFVGFGALWLIGSRVFTDLPSWVATRRIVVWFSHRRADTLGSGVLADIWSTLSHIVGFGFAAVLPLLWLWIGAAVWRVRPSGAALVPTVAVAALGFAVLGLLSRTGVYLTPGLVSDSGGGYLVRWGANIVGAHDDPAYWAIRTYIGTITTNVIVEVAKLALVAMLLALAVTLTSTLTSSVIRSEPAHLEPDGPNPDDVVDGSDASTRSDDE